MRKILLSLISLLAAVAALGQAGLPFPDHAGQDAVYSFDVPALTPSPASYKPLFIEHYGRHGSRYAYAPYYYTDLMQALRRADDKGVLTERGKVLLEDYLTHYDGYLLKMGDLTELGWRQEEEIARTMVRSFPQAFKGKGAYAYACASSSTRSIMSMAGFCAGLQGAAPKLDLVAEQGRNTLNATNPKDKANPSYTRREECVKPVAETSEEFFCRTVDGRKILGRLFADVDAALGELTVYPFVERLYILASGMNSLREDEWTDFSGIFAPEEMDALFEARNFTAAMAWWPNASRDLGVMEDIIADACQRLGEGRGGLTARFGHDHVFLPLLKMFGINQYIIEPSTSGEVIDSFSIKDAPMACNLQIVFYTSRRSNAPVLVKFLVNGVEARIGIPAFQGPYYRWDEVLTYLSERISRYPAR